MENQNQSTASKFASGDISDEMLQKDDELSSQELMDSLEGDTSINNDVQDNEGAEEGKGKGAEEIELTPEMLEQSVTETNDKQV